MWPRIKVASRHERGSNENADMSEQCELWELDAQSGLAERRDQLRRKGAWDELYALITLPSWPNGDFAIKSPTGRSATYRKSGNAGDGVSNGITRIEERHSED